MFLQYQSTLTKSRIGKRYRQDLTIYHIYEPKLYSGIVLRLALKECFLLNTGCAAEKQDMQNCDAYSVVFASLQYTSVW